MVKIARILMVAVCTLAASAAMATVNGGGGNPAPPSIQCNYDLTNTGSLDAYDVAIVIKGDVNGAFYNGIFGGDPTVTHSGTNTTLHWTDPTGAIGNGTKIHVGYTPVGTGSCPVLDIYWTDLDGKRISSSFIGVVWNHVDGTNETITNLTLHPVTVGNVRWACQADALPLAALNASNDYLSRSMVQIGDARTLGPGESWVIPVQATCRHCYCVTNFQTTGDQPGAIFSPWVQELIP